MIYFFFKSNFTTFFVVPHSKFILNQSVITCIHKDNSRRAGFFTHTHTHKIYYYIVKYLLGKNVLP